MSVNVAAKDDHSESPSLGEFQDLDKEIRRMSQHADAILDSILKVSSETSSFSVRTSGSKKIARPVVVETKPIAILAEKQTVQVRELPAEQPIPIVSDKVADYDEDDDMEGEMERLESISASIRDLLDQDDVPLMQPSESNLESDVKSAVSTPSSRTASVKSGPHSLREEMGSSEFILLSCTAVWVFIVVLIVQGRYFLLDANGNVQLPFGMFRG